jgi:hypothetical protein
MDYQANANFITKDETTAALFQLDTLLPVQYFETFRRSAPIEPEKKLMLAVLADALACFQKYRAARKGKGKNLFRDANEWIFGEDDDHLFSFENVCEVIGLDPPYVRRLLAQWKAGSLTGPPRAGIYRRGSARKFVTRVGRVAGGACIGTRLGAGASNGRASAGGARALYGRCRRKRAGL